MYIIQCLYISNLIIVYYKIIIFLIFLKIKFYVYI